VFTPVTQPEGGQDLHTDNLVLRALRCLGNAVSPRSPGGGAPLQHITASPRKIGDIAKAALALAHVQHGRLHESRWDHLIEPKQMIWLVPGPGHGVGGRAARWTRRSARPPAFRMRFRGEWRRPAGDAVGAGGVTPVRGGQVFGAADRPARVADAW
jgi:hypothetical protein